MLAHLQVAVDAGAELDAVHRNRHVQACRVEVARALEQQPDGEHVDDREIEQRALLDRLGPALARAEDVDETSGFVF